MPHLQKPLTPYHQLLKNSTLERGRGVHGRAQHDGKETDERRVAAAATARVGDRRERLDAMHRRVPPYRLLRAKRRSCYQKMKTPKSPKLLQNSCETIMNPFSMTDTLFHRIP
jgi:hypothetical protein